MRAAPAFDAPELVKIMEQMEPDEVNQLPFGVIRLDPDNNVVIYNRMGRALSGIDQRPVIGRNYFTDLAPCLNNEYFKGRIDKARQAGTLDITFSVIGDFADRNREFTVRIQAAKDGGLWIFRLPKALQT